MAAKTFFLVCAQAFLIQCAFSQCINRGPGQAYDGLAGQGLAGLGMAGPYGTGCGCGGVPMSGGGFPVTSTSPFAPTGLSIISENAIEGSVIVGGALPFLSAVVLDGVLPSTGAGAISYGCGNGPVGIVSESPLATGNVGPAGPAYGPALAAAPLYGPGLAAGPLYGPGLAPGLGYGGAGCGSGY